MLGKLFKYEWRSISKLLLPIHGFVLLFALLSRFYFTISGGTDALLNTDSTIIGTLTMLLIFALVIVISSIAIFTYIYSGYHFYKKCIYRPGLPYKYPACNTITALTFKRTCCFTMASY